MTAKRSPEELPRYVLAADHRVQLVEESRRYVGGERLCREFKYLLVEAFLAARDRSAQVRDGGGLILDPELAMEAIRRARSEGIAVGMPAEVSGAWPLELYPDLEERVLWQRPAFVKCLVRGRPDGDAFDAQNETVARLSDACRAAKAPLVLELIVPPREGEDERRFESRGRAELTAEWIRHLHRLGVHPAEWKLEGLEEPAAVAEVARALNGGERIVVLGKSAPPEQLSRWFAAARTSSRCHGFAVGRSIFWKPFLAHLGGARPEETVAAVRDAYLDVVRRWEAAS